MSELTGRVVVRCVHRAGREYNRHVSHILLHHNTLFFVFDNKNSHIQYICTIHAMSVGYIKF